MNFIISVGIIAILLLLYSIAMILINKFENVLVRNNLNDNIINLLNEECYTKKTLFNIKLIMVIRNLVYILGIVIIIQNNVAIIFIGFYPLIVLAIRELANKCIFKLLEHDYIDSEK